MLTSLDNISAVMLTNPDLQQSYLMCLLLIALYPGRNSTDARNLNQQATAKLNLWLQSAAGSVQPVVLAMFKTFLIKYPNLSLDYTSTLPMVLQQVCGGDKSLQQKLSPQATDVSIEGLDQYRQCLFGIFKRNLDNAAQVNKVASSSARMVVR